MPLYAHTTNIQYCIPIGHLSGAYETNICNHYQDHHRLFFVHISEERDDCLDGFPRHEVARRADTGEVSLTSQAKGG